MDKKKQKGKDWMKGIFLIILVFIVAGTCLFFYGKLTHKRTGDIEVSNVKEKIELYDYVLYDNATAYYTKEFKELKKMSQNKDLADEDLAKQVAKLYVIDLYSIDYKLNKYEVTSSQYFHSKRRKMHTQKVIDTLYNFVHDNYNGDRKQELPEVSNVEVKNVVHDKYNMSESKRKECWIVDVDISYVKDLGYDKKGEVTLVFDGDNMSVVSYKAL